MTIFFTLISEEKTRKLVNNVKRMYRGTEQDNSSVPNQEPVLAGVSDGTPLLVSMFSYVLLFRTVPYRIRTPWSTDPDSALFFSDSQ
jgi:L-lysine 2,3-aminomutase